MARVYVRGCWLRVEGCCLHRFVLRSLVDAYEYEALLTMGVAVSSDCRVVAADFEEWLHEKGARSCRVKLYERGDGV